MNSSLMSRLRHEKIISIVRELDIDKADQVFRALVDGGIKFIEISLNNPNAFKILKKWKTIEAPGVSLGIGTVTNIKLAKEAVEAGADFIITPNFDQEVVTYCMKHDVDIWPGVMTPSEIVNAHRYGAQAVKLFPADSLGPNYIKSIQAPLGDIPLISTGGIGVNNIREYLDAGSCAVAMGSSLLKKEWIENAEYDKITELATQVNRIAKGG